jgi:hypothetical protein
MTVQPRLKLSFLCPWVHAVLHYTVCDRARANRNVKVSVDNAACMCFVPILVLAALLEYERSSAFVGQTRIEMGMPQAAVRSGAHAH